MIKKIILNLIFIYFFFYFQALSNTNLLQDKFETIYYDKYYNFISENDKSNFVKNNFIQLKDTDFALGNYLVLKLKKNNIKFNGNNIGNGFIKFKLKSNSTPKLELNYNYENQYVEDPNTLISIDFQNKSIDYYENRFFNFTYLKQKLFLFSSEKNFIKFFHHNGNFFASRFFFDLELNNPINLKIPLNTEKLIVRTGSGITKDSFTFDVANQRDFFLTDENLGKIKKNPIIREIIFISKISNDINMIQYNNYKNTINSNTCKNFTIPSNETKLFYESYNEYYFGINLIALKKKLNACNINKNITFDELNIFLFNQKLEKKNLISTYISSHNIFPSTHDSFFLPQNNKKQFDYLNTFKVFIKEDFFSYKKNLNCIKLLNLDKNNEEIYFNFISDNHLTYKYNDIWLFEKKTNHKLRVSNNSFVKLSKNIFKICYLKNEFIENNEYFFDRFVLANKKIANTNFLKTGQSYLPLLFNNAENIFVDTIGYYRTITHEFKNLSDNFYAESILDNIFNNANYLYLNLIHEGQSENYECYIQTTVKLLSNKISKNFKFCSSKILINLNNLDKNNLYDKIQISFKGLNNKKIYLKSSVIYGDYEPRIEKYVNYVNLNILNQTNTTKNKFDFKKIVSSLFNIKFK